jgi:hypothetical protein
MREGCVERGLPPSRDGRLTSKSAVTVIRIIPRRQRLASSPKIRLLNETLPL